MSQQNAFVTPIAGLLALVLIVAPMAAQSSPTEVEFCLASDPELTVADCTAE